MNFDHIQVGQEVILGHYWDVKDSLKEMRIGVVVSVSPHRFVTEWAGVKTVCNKDNGEKRGWKGSYSTLCLNTPESIQAVHDRVERDRIAYAQKEAHIAFAKTLEGRMQDANIFWADVNGCGSSFHVRLSGLKQENAEKLVDLLIQNAHLFGRD